MPFSPANLNALLQTSAFNLWHYRTADTRAVVSAAGYFTPVAASLKPGDLMVPADRGRHGAGALPQQCRARHRA